jgi:hypothetical protein
MKSPSIALVIAALLGAPSSLAAQETKTARGTVSAVADDSLTLKMADHEMKFAIDSKTAVEVVGGGTRARRAQQAGQPGPKLTELLKLGQPVTVTYSESAGVMRAASVRAISSLGAGGGTSDAAANAAKSMTGTVKSVAATSLVIAGSSGMTSTFTFTVDGSTKVIGRGAGTAAAAAGGKTVVTDLVGVGDTVSVTYHQMSNSLHAAEIRVTAKGAPK